MIWYVGTLSLLLSKEQLSASHCVPTGSKLGSVCAVNRRFVLAHMHYATNICPPITRPAVSVHYVQQLHTINLFHVSRKLKSKTCIFSLPLLKDKLAHARTNIYIA